MHPHHSLPNLIPSALGGRAGETLQIFTQPRPNPPNFPRPSHTAIRENKYPVYQVIPVFPGLYT